MVSLIVTLLTFMSYLKGVMQINARPAVRNQTHHVGPVLLDENGKPREYYYRQYIPTDFFI